MKIKIENIHKNVDKERITLIKNKNQE